jgi:hypothetical protein
MALNYRDVREALTEFDRIVFEGRTEEWASNPAGEKTALLAARRVLSELDGYLTGRLHEIDDRYGAPRADP